MRALWLRARGGGIGKSQRLYFVTLNGHRYKRVVLQDTAMASALEDRLERVGPTPSLPGLVTRHENEIWVEFIRGVAPDGGAALAEALAAFYAELYQRAPERQPLARTRLPMRLERDLGFLERAGVLDARQHQRLRERAGRVEPGDLWTGFDYVDPVLKNFVHRADGAGLCAVDVESLVDRTPLGTGIAKAMIHWLAPWEDRFWSAFEAAEGPAIREAFPYVEICLIARWTKNKLLTGKHKAVDPRRLTRLADAGAGAAEAG